MDIVGFTSMSKEVPPDAVMTFLNQLFTHFDTLCDSHGVQKVCTISWALLQKAWMLCLSQLRLT